MAVFSPFDANFDKLTKARTELVHLNLNLGIRDLPKSKKQHTRVSFLLLRNFGLTIIHQNF